MSTWQSEVDFGDKTSSEVRASAEGMAFSIHNARWIFEIHLNDENFLALAAQIQEGVVQRRAMGASR